MRTSLDTLKDDIIEKVLSHLSNIRYMTEAERTQYIESLKADLKERKLITNLRFQSERTNAEDYNQTAFEMYIDMLTTFGYVERLYSTINTHQKLNRSVVNTLRSTIAGLNDKIDEVEAIISTNNAPQCVIEGFRTQNNQEWDPIYYTERYGERMPLAVYARFNSEQENITLNYTRQQNVMLYKSGVQLGDISITKQYGAGFITARNSETKLQNAIDNSPSSYWAETILSDAEIKIVGLSFENTEGVGKSNRSYYDLPTGAMCEICLTFEALAKVNEIVLNPFGAFPIDVIAIRYSLTDDDSDDIYDIVSPNKDGLLGSKSIDKEYAFHFQQITCKKLYILINQLHCIKDTYILSSNQIFKNELWFNATYNESKIAKTDTSCVFKPMYIDRAMEDNVWTYINNKIVTNKNIDVNDLLLNNKNKMLPVTKYQYTYGFYNIAPNFVEFQLAGFWVSSEIDAKKPIDTVRLRTEEEHYYDSFGRISTDIEFYITSKKNPSYNDWKPICPVNKDYVYKELLQIDYEYCYLRHNAVCQKSVVVLDDGTYREESERPIVYYNDIILTEDVDYILRFNPDGTVYAVEIPDADKFAMYTVSYTPVESSKELVLSGYTNVTPSTCYEEIAGNGTSCYALDGYPYYNVSDPDSTETYLRIVDITTGRIINQFTGEGSIIECVTDKKNPAASFKNFIANTNKIQYYTYEKNLYFNQPIGSDKKIEFNYPSLDSKIRLKAILRRNTKHDLWITPVLKKFTIEFTTL